jgi:hypothetical protein
MKKGDILKPLKTFAIFLGLTTTLMACDPIRGTLQVDRSLSVKTGNAQNCPAETYPCPENVKLATVNPGSYSMDVDALGASTFRIYLKTDRKQLNIELDIPSGKSIPSNGTFSLSSAESGQPFDLLGQVQTDVSQTQETRTQESCQITHTEQVCGLKPGQSGQGPVYACWTETFTREGIEDVQYYYRTTTENLQAQLVQSGAQAAHYAGSKTSTDKIYTYKGGCHERYPF